MKPRKGPAGGRRKKGVSDVTSSTNLPPLVEGQLRCFLKLTVSKILWTIPKPPASTIIRVRWWGETSDGTIFRPRDNTQMEQKAIKTTTRYAIRCGPMQFTAYLTDMDMLVLEVMTKLDHLPIGKVQVHGLPQLSPIHPIAGFFTIVSPTSEKLGELKVSLTLEPLSDTYENSSSLLSTDISLDTAFPTQALQKLVGTVSGKESVSSSRTATPRGKDHLYFQENSETIKDYFMGPVSQSEVLKCQEESHPMKQISFSHSSEKEPQSKAAGDNHNDAPPMPVNSPVTKDLLSALLDQGNKLRNAMVVSSVKANLDATAGEMNPLMKKEIYTTAKSQVNPPSSKGLFQDLLDNSIVSPIKNPLRFALEDPDQNLDTLSESRAIQLLLGSDPFPLHNWNGTESPPDSLSIGSDICDNSELNNPHYDQSLLEKLFYSAPKSNSSLSDFLSDGEDDEVQVNRETMKKSVLRNGSGDLSISQKVSDSQAHDLKEMDAEKNTSNRRPSSGDTLESTEETQVMNLTLDRLALLGRVHLARVIIESLKIPSDNIQIVQAKRTSKGKPPRPTSSVKRTFFVEYHFPVASSKNTAGQISLATEITRVASSKISNGVVNFQQRFVFPVQFSGIMIEQWWNSDLTFRIFLRKGAQRKPEPIGTAALSLRNVIQSELLALRSDLPVQLVEGTNEKTQIGPLKVSLELSCNSKDFTSVSTRSSYTAEQSTYAVSSPRVKVLEPDRDLTQAEPPPLVKVISHDSPMKSNEKDQKAIDVPCSSMVQQPASGQSFESSSLMRHAGGSAEESDSMLLHLILLVPDGKDFVAWEKETCSPCNLYLNCKLFSTQEATRSPVIWGTPQPSFNFSQVAPVSLTRMLLERMKNNMMIIEVWNKVMSPGKDRLLGLVKLPLHQLYMSFSDPKISRLLLQAQYPVVAVDSYMPVMDVFTGHRNGSLRVLLAMGSSDQVMALQRLKNDEGTVPSFIQRPAHFLDLPPTSLPVVESNMDGLTEHIFEIHVENVKGLTPLQSTVWGEADCYVQYCFPFQQTNSGVLKETDLLECGIILKPVRSSTTLLCTPDPVFNDKRTHSLVVPTNVPVQRLLLSAFSTQGLTSGGGIHFEVWCRYYYPNVRDQMVAKGILPLSRLCAMVTMQHHEEVGIQIFNLPLIPRAESTEECHLPSSGLLNVSVKYRYKLKKVEGVLAARTVPISVQLHRASGLQAAARVVAEHDPSFQYIADVGVNAFVSVQLSFLPNDQKRSTRAVARTFSPEFDHHTEFSCNLVIQRSSGEACSLAELLQFAEVIFFIHHQNIQKGSGVNGPPSSQDHLLGIVRIPTKHLLTKRSGITGWYPVTLPQELMLSQCESVIQNVVGGLELSIAFVHHMDRERVMEAARTLCWNLEEHHNDNVDEWQQKGDLVTCTVSIPRVRLPMHCLLFAGQECIHKSTYCYLRYKLYSNEAVWSGLKRPKLTEDEKQATVKFDLINTVELSRHPQLLWYLCEERLEIQVWRAYGKDTKEERPLNTDRLIGCAYVDLVALAEKSSRTLTVSGVYPLFKRNALDLSGAAVRVHVSLAPAYPQAAFTQKLGYAEDGSYTDDEEKVNSLDLSDKEKPVSESQSTPNPIAHAPVQSPASQETPEVDLETTFAVSITVERAMHLSLKGIPLTERTIATPSCCVSFAVAGSETPITTSVIENTDSPVWNFQQQARLLKDLLLDSQQTLVFKVWHKTDIERVIGFASVDLSPLLSGFQSVCGWYNISDFSGHCQGQIKVCITPLEAILYLKEEKLARSQSREPFTSVFGKNPLVFPGGSVHACFPNYITPSSELLIKNNMSQDTDIRTVDRSIHPGNWISRHEEHMQNVRRFHESLQQTERSTHSVREHDAQSQSSSPSVLTALRKNLSELDEIQRYFNQKLKRSFMDLDHDRPPKKNQEILSGQQESVTAVLDNNTQNLLEKSKQLVSQVGNFIDDLQVVSKDVKESFTMASSNMPLFAQYKRDIGPVIQEQQAAEAKSSHTNTSHFSSLGSPSFRRDPDDTFEEQAVSKDVKESFTMASSNIENKMHEKPPFAQYKRDIGPVIQEQQAAEAKSSHTNASHFSSLGSSSFRRDPDDTFEEQAVFRNETYLPKGQNQSKKSSNTSVQLCKSSGIPCQKDVDVWPMVSQNECTLKVACSHEDTSAFPSLEISSGRRGMLDEFLNQIVPGEETLTEEPENEIQSCSEEDYEENIIEPRTLNEVTAMTDKTSPWSSILSESGQEPRGSFEQQSASTKSLFREKQVVSLLRDDHENMISAAKASDFQSGEDSIASLEREDLRGSDGDIETDDSEPLQLPQSSRSHHFREKSLESINSNKFQSLKREKADNLGAECRSQTFSRRPSNLLGGGDCEVSQGITTLNKSGPSDSDFKQRDDTNEDLHFNRSVQSKSSRCDGNSDGEPVGYLSTTLDKTAKTGIVLSDPVLVPNFFLPPQHLEASMRMLRYSNFSTSKKGSDATSDDSTSRSISFRKHTRPKASLISAELPKKETDRIARIFATRFSSKE
uniref:C2 domain-containing protein 3 isoform X2 n=1 Tax=Geotrypetes seraphini TaxID=260995 RepID=A0A6P8RJL9_GEOSA|nr:C2 domain-containing protein 3 isoform X2 [Geotrypetes seraphini]